jgi:predicted nucleotidyltransferase
MSAARLIGQRRSGILGIAARHGAGNVRLFGSVLRGQDQPDSDVDFLVDVVGETTAWFPGSLVADLSPLIRDEVIREAISL